MKAKLHCSLERWCVKFDRGRLKYKTTKQIQLSEMETCRCNCKILKSQANGVSTFHEKTLRLSNENSSVVQNQDFINPRQKAPLLSFTKKNGGGRGEERELGRVVSKEDKRVGDSLDLSSDTTSYSEEESLIGSEIEGKGCF